MSWFSKKPDPIVRPISVKPADNIIFAVATGDYNVFGFPFQYVNWALEYVGQQPTCRAGNYITFKMCSLVHTACKHYVKEKMNGLC